MSTPNNLREKSYAFALRTVNCYQYLIKEKKEYTLAKQLLRSGTSIGANIWEGGSAFSKKDFIYKYQISLKEAQETLFWIHLLRDTGYFNPKNANSLITDCEKLIWLLTRSLKTAKANKGTESNKQE